MISLYKTLKADIKKASVKMPKPHIKKFVKIMEALLVEEVRTYQDYFKFLQKTGFKSSKKCDLWLRKHNYGGLIKGPALFITPSVVSHSLWDIVSGAINRKNSENKNADTP